jgi:DNA repair photolyase
MASTYLGAIYGIGYVHGNCRPFERYPAVTANNNGKTRLCPPPIIFNRRPLSVTQYKNFISLTSQAYFCSAPIRLDSYNSCDFGCTYCFSRERSRLFANAGTRTANPNALRQRFGRVNRGVVSSALDEFLQRRVPIQLGGLQDAFPLREAESGVTLRIMQILRNENYPTIISTKGNAFLGGPYLNALKGMNLVFRISAAGVSEQIRPYVERKCELFDQTLKKIDILSRQGISTALRIQPVFPGFEQTALDMATRAAEAGVKQVTFEYLKLPSETIRTSLITAKETLGYDVVRHMTKLGLTKIGPDWALTRDVKRPFVRAARGHCKALGIAFGAGDTEFIHWSDGSGCCGSSDLSLVGASQFTANFVGAIKYGLSSKDSKITFSFFDNQWFPSYPIGNYFDSRSRIRKNGKAIRDDWIELIARRWNPGVSPYSPLFFDGVVKSNDTDESGYMIYDVSTLRKELNSSSDVEIAQT